MEKFTQGFANKVRELVEKNYETTTDGLAMEALVVGLDAIGIPCTPGTLDDLFREKLSGVLEKRKGVGWLPLGAKVQNRFGVGGKVTSRDPAAFSDDFIEDLRAVLEKGLTLNPKGLSTGYAAAKLEDHHPEVVANPGIISAAIVGRLGDRFAIVKGQFPIQRVKVA